MKEATVQEIISNGYSEAEGSSSSVAYDHHEKPWRKYAKEHWVILIDLLYKSKCATTLIVRVCVFYKTHKKCTHHVTYMKGIFFTRVESLPSPLALSVGKKKLD